MLTSVRAMIEVDGEVVAVDDRARSSAKQKVADLTEAAAHLGASGITLRVASERGKIGAERPLPDGPWVLNRRNLETRTAAQLVEGVS